MEAPLIGEYRDAPAPRCGERLEWGIPEAVDFSAHIAARALPQGEQRLQIYLPDDPFVTSMFCGTLCAIVRESCEGEA